MSDTEKLRAFARAVLNDWPHEPEWDSGELQDIAVKYGLLEPVTVTESCGEHCNCADWGFPSQCLRFTDVIKEVKP